ncbi:hypothetical protein AVEN_264420-1 [Araneus ventricosus]|uniref:Uncharacterized protein n=1 Tax=Araneus ventricosus TaxID=182803 RepID=A0A4Y2HUG3_ARAVE|nr:hypothetical protein AVEN_264420-1 [Araneus ventricosus]
MGARHPCYINVSIRPVLNSPIPFLGSLPRCPQAQHRDAEMSRFQVACPVDPKHSIGMPKCPVLRMRVNQMCSDRQASGYSCPRLVKPLITTRGEKIRL